MNGHANSGSRRDESKDRKPRLPRAMVMVYMPELRHSVWCDFQCRSRTIEGLRKVLKKGIRNGEYVAYRLIYIHEEVMGNIDDREVQADGKRQRPF